MSIILGYDAATLREKVDLVEAGQRLALLEEQDEPATLTERIGLLRLVGRLDEALVLAEESLAATRENGDDEQVLLARIRRAQVRQFRGELVESCRFAADAAEARMAETAVSSPPQA